MSNIQVLIPVLSFTVKALLLELEELLTCLLTVSTI